MHKRNDQIAEPFQLANNYFPPLRSAPIPPPLMHSFAVTANAHTVQQQHTSEFNPNECNELFTFAEISNIMLNCVNELAQCNSKLDHIRVIANLLGNVCK